MSDYQLVDLDVQQVQQQLEATFGRPVTELEAHVWLRHIGFIPFNQCWFADAQALSTLGRGVLRPSPKQDN